MDPVQNDGGGTVPEGSDAFGAPLRYVERLELLLRGAHSVDDVARTVLDHLARLSGVSRVGLGLSEGAGRRIRFVASDAVGEPELAWCHIDAYDDVPLTTVTRTGESVVGGLEDLAGRYADLVQHQRSLGTRALAAVPVTSGSSSLGGLVFYFDEDQPFDRAQLRVFETAGRRTAEAIRRVRSRFETAAPQPATETADGALRAALDLDADPTAAGAARRFLRRQLEAWEIDEDAVDSAALCLSELVNNVIMHARTSSRLTVSLEDGRLWVMLRDLGGAVPPGAAKAHQPVEDTDEYRVFGRGLTLVDALSDDWGSERDAVGTTAWFAFEVDRSDDDVRTG